ncbi:hypothetical protein SNE40_014151 [Patella caerulea]|uniref:Uncharacterized protein n=1 Tax=Patella caerulea TaxID=87958 RepID=A0AAN8JHG7_PATCE
MEDIPTTSTKRGRDSYGETPKPENKTHKMDDRDSESATGNVYIEFLTKQMATLIDAVSEVKINQEKMTGMLEKKMEDWKAEIMGHIDSKVRVLQDELSIDITTERIRVDQIVNNVQEIKDNLSRLEVNNETRHGRLTENNDLTV